MPEHADAWAPPAMGQVAGVSRGHNGSVWAFHRADRVWGPASFDDSGERFLEDQPIGEDVMIELDQDTGAYPAREIYRPNKFVQISGHSTR